MPEYLTPGVYIEEVSSGVRPIEGVGTSTAGFIGIAPKGRPNRATFITSWAQYVREFGDIAAASYLGYTVSQFFSNGGKRCYVVRALDALSSQTATFDIPDREGAPAKSSLRVTATGAGAWGNDIALIIEDGTDDPVTLFKIRVFYEGKEVETFDNLSMDPDSMAFVETEINDVSAFIEVESLEPYLVSRLASSLTTNPLGDPVAFPVAPATQTVTVEMPDGTTNSVDLSQAARDDIVDALNASWGPLNISASLTSTDHLQITHNSPGHGNYFILSGTATNAGNPFEGLAGISQTRGQGSAVGGVLKSLAQPTFDITAGNETLTITVNAYTAINVALTVANNRPVADILSEIQTALNAGGNGLVSAALEGNRIVLTTSNRGLNDSQIAVGGSANGTLQFRDYARAVSTISGLGRSEAAFIQSGAGPFTIQNGANFTIIANNGDLGADVSIPVTFNQSSIPNLLAVTAETVRDTINTASAAATPTNSVVASVINNRVVVRHARRGNYYSLSVTDGLHSPNIALKFNTQEISGYVESDTASPYYRPSFNLDSAGVNQVWSLAGGDDGAQVSDFDLIGTASKKSGLRALDDVMDVNFIVIPGASANVTGQAVGYCATRGNCFFIADAPGDKSKDARKSKDNPVTPDEVRDFMANSITAKSKYGALYYPWIEIADPKGAGKNPKRLVPPSGFIAGLYARIDTMRGVHKAPAGTEATLFNTIGLEYSVTDNEQAILNPVGVNCVRTFPNSGTVIWGARTMATQSDPEGRYVPIVRYTIYLKESIFRGTQWAVFEPNGTLLWSSLRANITDFMMGEFRKGALAGTTPKEAFSVKCDADLNPESEVAAGRVNMEVKFAPLRPAEFVIIRISQKTQRPEG